MRVYTIMDTYMYSVLYVGEVNGYVDPCSFRITITLLVSLVNYLSLTVVTKQVSSLALLHSLTLSQEPLE